MLTILAFPARRIFWMFALSENTSTLVLAIGNPLRGDDGVGAAVLEHLTQISLPSNVTLLDGGTAGFEIVLLMQGYTQVIVIDAADMGLEPGTWRYFEASLVQSQSRDLYLRGTLHYAGLAEALSLGEALGVLPPDIRVFGVQPEEIGWEPGLSEPVQAAIPTVAEAILEELSNGKDSRC